MRQPTRKFMYSLIGESRDKVREILVSVVRGAQEDGSTIKFQKSGWTWTIFFTDGVCNKIDIKIAPVMRPDELKLYNENIDGF